MDCHCVKPNASSPINDEFAHFSSSLTHFQRLGKYPNGDQLFAWVPIAFYGIQAHRHNQSTNTKHTMEREEGEGEKEEREWEVGEEMLGHGVSSQVRRAWRHSFSRSHCHAYSHVVTEEVHSSSLFSFHLLISSLFFLLSETSTLSLLTERSSSYSTSLSFSLLLCPICSSSVLLSSVLAQRGHSSR